MCLYLKKLKRGLPQARVARKDIICYKVLNVSPGGISNVPVVYSPYKGYVYTLGKPVHSLLERKDIHQYGTSHPLSVVNVGLHSCATLEAAIAEANWHSRAFVFVAIIPKGSRYYKGRFTKEDDSYASEQLIVLDRNDPRSLAVLGISELVQPQ